MECFGFLTYSEKEELFQLENKRRKLILDKDKERCLKSRAIWFEAGDDNTKLFHHFVNCSKNTNSIWKIDRQYGSWDENFTNIATGGITHFQTLLKEDN